MLNGMMGHNGGPVMTMEALDSELAKEFAKYYDDPYGFVKFAFPWGEKELKGFEGPEYWQAEYLNSIGEKVRKHMFDGRNAVDAIQMATASGHGIGKSALTAWLTIWIMCTRPFCKGIVTANTSPQLETKTWAEIAKWTRRCIARHWFRVSTGKGSMKMLRIGYEDTWRVDAQTCREENSEAFAGLHAANSTPFYIFDEASAIPDKIWEVAEGGLTDGEPMWFVFGNPTRNTGRFHKCFNRLRHRWDCRQIDSRKVSLTNKSKIAEWIADYGVDSDFVKVRVRGIFPSQSIRQFISVEAADAARGRKLRPEQYNFAPKILTCDPAWEGDDELVIGLRQGLFFQVLRTMPKNDNDIQIANILANLEDEHQADAVFTDAGYGTGIYSAGLTMGRKWRLVWFASTDIPDEGCANMRAYIWNEGKKWLAEGGAFPDDDEVLYMDLIGPETVPRLDGKIQLESKIDMKRRDVASPNRADALMISFAYPVAKKTKYSHNNSGRLESEYNPLG